MTKIVDSNSFWEIKHNPISKVGVFPYMGRSISDECEPDKVYYVYRSADTLSQSVPTWDNPPKPFINDHEMLGEGFSKIDDRPVQGVIHNPVFENDTLYADISVYSESLKKKIEDGKKELSLGYFCKYRKEKGVYKGQAYDYVQEDMVGNHIALVDNGRCGSDVKVFDSKCTMDSLDIVEKFESENDLKKNQENGTIKTTERKDNKMKHISLDELKTILDEVLEEEKAKEVSEKVEEKATDEEEKEEKKAEDKCGKDEDNEEEMKEAKDKKHGKDESEEEEKKDTEDEDVSPADVMAFLKLILEEVRRLNGKKTTDEDDEEKKSEDSDDEEKKDSEDEDDDEKKDTEDEDDDDKKEVKDSSDVIVTFAKDSREAPKSFMDDPALRKYLNI